MNAKRDQEVQKAIANVSDEAQQIDVVAGLRGWFRPDESSVFYPIVQKYLSGELDPKEASKNLLRPIDEAYAANKAKDINILDLWYSIIHSAKRTSFRDSEPHDRLIKLMEAIREHPEPPRVKDDHLYSKLHYFGMAARETMNDSPGCGAGYLTPECHAYANMVYLYVLMTKSGLMDFWIYAIWEMREALETSHTDDEPNDWATTITAAQKYDAFVPSAAVWVLSLGKELYEREQDLAPTNPNQGNPGKGGDLWKGKAEFSKGRWALWKSRFQEVANMGDVTEETRKVAKEAAEIMTDCEKS